MAQLTRLLEIAAVLCMWSGAFLGIMVLAEPERVTAVWDWSTRRRRPAVFFGALALVLVPTLFTIFPSWGVRWSLAAKAAVLIVWLLAALIVAAGSIKQGEQLEDIALRLPPARQRVADERRERIVPFLLDAVLAAPVDVPPGHRFRVYMPDEDDALLRPVYEPPGGDLGQVWHVGHGATGVAWETRSRVVALGPAVHDETFRLTAEERERYRDLRAVAATPISLAGGEMIGVLSVSSEADENFLATPQGVEAHVFLAAVCAEILSLED